MAATTSKGGVVEHPEFIVYDKCQALPEYAIWYKHTENCFCTHCISLNRTIGVQGPDAVDVVEVSANGDTSILAVKSEIQRKLSIPGKRDIILRYGGKVLVDSSTVA